MAILDTKRDRLLIIGGDGAPEHMVWTLDLKTLTWQAIKTKGRLPPRRFHSATLDLAFLKMPGRTVGRKIFHPPARGDYHLCLDAPRNRLILFGGWGYSDTWILDLTFTWKEVLP